MSAFYFLVRDGDGQFINDEPYEYADLTEAIEAAKEAIVEMAPDGAPLNDGIAISIDIQNDEHAPVAHLRLRFSIGFATRNALKE